MSEPAGGPVSAVLREEIRASGPLPFDRFQESALYSGAGGYYERPGRVGRGGDFITGASWHPAFGRCLLRLLSRLESLGEAGREILDVGAGEGELLRGLASVGVAKTGRAVTLFGVERSSVRRALAAGAVPEATFYESLDALPAPVTGLLVAYELFDALPVRALRVDSDGGLLERMVALDEEDRFVWTERPAIDPAEILQRLHSRGAALEPGQLFEVRPGAAALALAVAEALRQGVILVFDYGAGTRSLYGPARPFGTLEAFQGHRVTRDVLSDPGSRDITAWVDFDEIAEVFQEAGFDVAGPISQSRLLLATGVLSGIGGHGQDPASMAPAAAAERNAVAQLFLPGGMGESIRVLIATKGTNPAGSLAAFPPSPGV